jgi:hypothetical protein
MLKSVRQYRGGTWAPAALSTARGYATQFTTDDGSMHTIGLKTAVANESTSTAETTTAGGVVQMAAADESDTCIVDEIATKKKLSLPQGSCARVTIISSGLSGEMKVL